MPGRSPVALVASVRSFVTTTVAPVMTAVAITMLSGTGNRVDLPMAAASAAINTSTCWMESPGSVRRKLLAAASAVGPGSTPAVAIGPVYDYTDRDSFGFSPDGTKVLLAQRSPGQSVIIDLATGATTPLADVTGPWSWQRLAP